MRGVLGACALALASAALGSGEEKAAPRDVLELTNGRIVVGVLPPLGGRVVELKVAGGENLLDADPRFWKPPFPEPGPRARFERWNGRVVWVAPQDDFWAQQDLRPDLKQQKARWPPDPFNETGRFDVVERTSSRLRLKGGTSPVTGLAFEHELEITGERTVRMKTTARNGRTTPVSWSLWPNTRVRPEGQPYVPLDPMAPVRIEGPRPDERDAASYPSGVRAGWFTFAPGARPESPRRRLWAKAYLRPSRGLIAYFLHRQLLLIRAAVVPPARVHPEEAFVEVYRGTGKNATILELEMQGPYETLAPAGTTSFEQTFEVLDYAGPEDEEAQVRRLQELPD